MLQTILNNLNAIPQSSWIALASFLGGSTLVATVLQVVKHWYSIDGKKLVMFLLSVFSFVAAFSDFLLSGANQSPQLLGQHTATILAFAVIVHRFAVSPVYGWITKTLLDASNYRASVAPTSVQVLPTESLPTDFSV